MEVQWEHHSSELVQSLASFLTEGVLQDVTLVASEGKRIRAHRVILAASSEYFKVWKKRYLNSYKELLKFLGQSSYSFMSLFRKYSYQPIMKNLERFQSFF